MNKYIKFLIKFDNYYPLLLYIIAIIMGIVSLILDLIFNIKLLDIFSSIIFITLGIILIIYEYFLNNKY
jgi:Gpi18-like mannosyltransferase